MSRMYIMDYLQEIKMLRKQVKEMTKLHKEVILPRLDQQEIEIYFLRQHVWPYVQACKEHNQLDQIREKRDFLQVLEDEEIRLLLKKKAEYSPGGLQRMEYDKIIKKMKHIHFEETDEN